MVHGMDVRSGAKLNIVSTTTSFGARTVASRIEVSRHFAAARCSVFLGTWWPLGLTSVSHLAVVIVDLGCDAPPLVRVRRAQQDGTKAADADAGAGEALRAEP